MRNRDTLIIAAAFAVAAGGCNGSEDAVGRDPGDTNNTPGLSNCVLDSDCPGGLICQATICVSPEDMLPPDIEDDITVGRPEASAGRLFSLAPEGDALLAMDPEDLTIEAVPVAAGPHALAVIPGREAAIVLSGPSRTLTLVDMTGATSVSAVRLGRRFGAVSISPDGAWAVLWTPDGIEPEDGAEGLVGLVDLVALAAGTAAPMELAAGFRHTDVHYVMAGGVTVQVAIIAKSAVTVFEPSRLGEDGYRAQRILLPESFADLVGREVVAAPGASVLLFKSLDFLGVGALDVSTAAWAEIPLPGRATDLDLAPSGDRAVAAVRGTSQVALLPLPDVLTSSLAVRLIDVAGVTPGQVELSADGTHAAIFSRQDGSEVMGWLDLETEALRIIDQLEKQVRAVVLSPDGAGALVLHQAAPTSSVADDYERAVDQDEGYALVDLANGFAQLKRTRGAPPQDVSFGASGRWAAVTVLDEAGGAHRIESADFATLVVRSFELASAPRFAGALPGGERAWVTQVHPAGRISVLDMDLGRLRTLTGFRLNAEIVVSGGEP